MDANERAQRDGGSSPMNGHEGAYRAVEALATAAETIGDEVVASTVRPASPQRLVGCEGIDGLIRQHPESETCDVCRLRLHEQADAALAVQVGDRLGSTR